MRAALLTIALLMTVSLPARAAEMSKEKRALVSELITLSNVHAFGAGFMVQMLTVASPEVTADQRAEAIRMMMDNAEMRQMIDDSVMSSYDAFSESELRKLIAFYKSPLGRKNAAAHLRIATEGRGAVAEKTGAALKESLARSKSLRTMADMRSLATASEAYATDFNHYPDATTVHQLAPIIQPIYIRTAPLQDAWDHDFVYMSFNNRSSYRIVSAGPDGVVASESRKAGTRPSKKSDDIIYENGEFIQAPPDVPTR